MTGGGNDGGRSCPCASGQRGGHGRCCDRRRASATVVNISVGESQRKDGRREKKTYSQYHASQKTAATGAGAQYAYAFWPMMPRTYLCLRLLVLMERIKVCDVRGCVGVGVKRQPRQIRRSERR